MTPFLLSILVWITSGTARLVGHALFSGNTRDKRGPGTTKSLLKGQGRSSVTLCRQVNHIKKALVLPRVLWETKSLREQDYILSHNNTFTTNPKE